MPDEEYNTEQADFLELSQEVLDRGGLLRFQARGNSMYPFIKNGDVVIVEPQNGNSVSAGDIIFYRRPRGSPIAHRLVKIKGHKESKVLIAKGDAMKNVDPPVNDKQVMGRVILIERDGRTLKLKGWLARIYGRLTAWLASRRYPNQRRVVRYIDRMGWFGGGRRVR